jgi:hypothetical protein
VSVPQVRLAAATDPGADVYNAYHLLMQLSGLYAQAAASDHHVEGRTLWGALADQCVEDLGELFGIWSVVAQRAETPALTPDAQLFFDLRSACMRAEVMVRMLNVWVPLQRWARLLGLVERKWGRLAARLAPRAGDQAKRLEQLRERATARGQRVLGLYESYRSEQARLDAAFDASATLLINGGLSA